jgi:signal transduction histidine kinase
MNNKIDSEKKNSVARLETQLQKNRERFRLMFNEVPCYISVQDSDLKIVHSNRKFKEAFGDCDGDYCYRVYKHRTEPCVTCPVEATFDDGEIHHSEEVVTSLAGESINTLVSTAPIYNSQGDIELVMEMSADITRIRNLQKQLTNFGLLVGSISHGLKGLLTGLDGGMYLLNSGLEKDKKDRVEKGQTMIHRNVEQIRQVVLDLLYIAGEEEHKFEPYSLRDAAVSVAKRLAKRTATYQIDFQLELNEDIGSCDVDANAIKESLFNILASAFESCRLDTRKDAHFVRFSLTSDGDNAVFNIEDNGIGLNQESRENMFNLNFSNTGKESTGLGLFTANKVIEAHRGVIEVKSEPGKGTSYHIRIPKVRNTKQQ